jgi:hypothetical protein
MKDDLAHTAPPRCAGFVSFILCAALTCAADAAQRFPNRPVRMVVAATVGAGPDILARTLGIKLTEAWGEQIVVDNRAGASGLIGAETVAKSAPDGHTLWMSTMTQLISTTLYQRLNLAKEFAPVGMVATTPYILAASAALPVKSMAELIDARSEREFSEDHLPGAVNLPVGVNDEYAEVGTTHRTDTHRAYAIGVSYALRNISRSIEGLVARHAVERGRVGVASGAKDRDEAEVPRIVEDEDVALLFEPRGRACVAPVVNDDDARPIRGVAAHAFEAVARRLERVVDRDDEVAARLAESQRPGHALSRRKRSSIRQPDEA